MKRSHLHAVRTGGACAALVAALGLAFACSEAPTETTLDDLAPQFAKGGGKGKPGGGGSGDPAPTVTKNLLPIWNGEDPEPGDPGVYGDGKDAIAQACPGHAVRLVAPGGMPALAKVPLPVLCDESGRVQVHLPEDPLTFTGDVYGDPGPSFDFHKKTGKVMATGWMRPTLNLFWDCEGNDSSFCNFVWTNGDVTDNGDGHTSVTGTCARLYVDYTGEPIEPEGETYCDAGVFLDKDGNSFNVRGFSVKLHVDLTVAQ